MSIDIDRFLVETATRVAITKNENGDTMYGSTTSVPCLYKDDTGLNEVQNREEVTIDGILFLNAAEAPYAVRGAIYYHPDEGYLKVVKRFKAKRLVADNTTQFMECGVIRHRQVS